MNSQDTIDSLVKDIAHVKRAKSSTWMLVTWTFWTLLSCVLLYKAIWGYRPDFFNDFKNQFFQVEVFLIVFISALSIRASFRLATPHGVASVWKTISFLFLLCGAFFALQIYHFQNPTMKFVMLGKRPYCMYELWVFSGLMWMAFQFMMTKAAPTKKWSQSFLSALACSSVNLGMMHIACMYEPTHIIKFHFFPMLVFTFLGFWLGPKFLNWDKVRVPLAK